VSRSGFVSWWAVGAVSGKPFGALSGIVRRSGGCWVSHGTSGRSGERLWPCGTGGFTPWIGLPVKKNRSVPNG
jgi:hypothetical protein